MRVLLTGAPVEQDGRDGVDAEAMHIGQRGQAIGVAFAITAEGPVLADGDLLEIGEDARNFVDEFGGGKFAQRLIEFHGDDGDGALRAHVGDFLLQGGEARRDAFGCDDGEGMGLEGECGDLACSKAFDDGLVAEVDAVKDTDGEAGDAGVRLELSDGNGTDEHKILISRAGNFSHERTQRKQRGRWEKQSVIQILLSSLCSFVANSLPPEARDFGEGEERGKQRMGVGSLLERVPTEGAFEGEVAGLEAAELDEMRAAAEVLPDVMAIGADVKALAALDAKFNQRKRDVVDDVGVDVDEARLALDGLAGAGEFVERDAALLEGRDHRRDLIKVTGVFLEGGLELLAGEVGHGLFLECLAVGVLGIGDDAELHGRGVFLVLGHEQVLDFGCLADDEHEEAGGERIERAAMADLLEMKAIAHVIHDVVGGATGGLVDEENSVCFHNLFSKN